MDATLSPQGKRRTDPQVPLTTLPKGGLAEESWTRMSGSEQEGSLVVSPPHTRGVATSIPSKERGTGSHLR